MSECQTEKSLALGIGELGFLVGLNWRLEEDDLARMPLPEYPDTPEEFIKPWVMYPEHGAHTDLSYRSWLFKVPGGENGPLAIRSRFVDYGRLLVAHFEIDNAKTRLLPKTLEPNNIGRSVFSLLCIRAKRIAAGQEPAESE